GEDNVAPTSWLLETDAAIEEEVLFDNFLEDDDVVPYLEIAEKTKLSAQQPETIAAFLDAVGKPLKNKALQFFGWRADKEHFDAAAFYSAAYAESGAYPLMDG